jgi:hypothetical protein
MNLNVGDRVPLSCGHQGRVIWINEDDATMGRQGSSGRCAICGKGSKDRRTQTTYPPPTSNLKPIRYDDRRIQSCR